MSVGYKKAIEDCSHLIYLGHLRCKNLWYFSLSPTHCFSLFYCTGSVRAILIAIVTSLVRFTGSYTEDEPFILMFIFLWYYWYQLTTHLKLFIPEHALYIARTWCGITFVRLFCFTFHGVPILLRNLSNKKSQQCQKSSAERTQSKETEDTSCQVLIGRRNDVSPVREAGPKLVLAGSHAFGGVQSSFFFPAMPNGTLSRP